MEKITAIFWHYRRAEPQKETYAVTYFPDASDFDPAPTAGQQTMRAYCEDSGWEFVAQWAQMQIFSTVREEPVPIETEESGCLETTHRAMKRNYLPGNVLLLAVTILQICTQFFIGNYDIIGKLADGAMLCLLLFWGLLLCWLIQILLDYGRWYRLSKRAVEQGGACAECSRWYGKWRKLLLLPFVLLVFCWLWETRRQGYGVIASVSIVLATGMLVGMFGVKAGLKRAKLSRGLSRGITMAACVVLNFAVMGGMVTVVIQGGARIGFKSSHWNTMRRSTMGTPLPGRCTTTRCR